KKNPALFQHTVTFFPYRQDFFHIAVGNRMENQVKGLIRKRKGLSHIRFDNLNVVPFPFCHHLFTCKLPVRIVQHGTDPAKRRKNGHLLSTLPTGRLFLHSLLCNPSHASSNFPPYAIYDTTARV